MVSNKIKAAVLTETNCPLEIIDGIEIPHCEQGQVLVKVLFSGVCHSQLMEVRGNRGEDKYLPHMLGHEGVGLVQTIGDGVTKVKVGDKVVLGWIKGMGIDVSNTVYNSPIGKINAGAVTTLSDYSVISENRLVKLPQGINEKTAVLLGCALPTGAGIVINQLKPKANSTIGVYGLGGIGLSALLAMNHFKPQNIIAFDIEENKLKLAKELGATHCYSVDEQGIAQFKIDFPQGLDSIVEAAGKTSTIETAFSLVKRGGGRCVFASHPPVGDLIKLDPFELICGKSIEGSWGGATQPDQDLQVIVDIINKYQLPVEKLLSNEYSLEQINQALDDLEQRKITRALITF
jgi:S-(hydroxymethyl)glutathione dehydrogenase/alcohol dehydrogenase